MKKKTQGLEPTTEDRFNFWRSNPSSLTSGQIRTEHRGRQVGADSSPASPEENTARWLGLKLVIALCNYTNNKVFRCVLRKHGCWNVDDGDAEKQPLSPRDDGVNRYFTGSRLCSRVDHLNIITTAPPVVFRARQTPLIFTLNNSHLYKTSEIKTLLCDTTAGPDPHFENHRFRSWVCEH